MMIFYPAVLVRSFIISFQKFSASLGIVNFGLGISFSGIWVESLYRIENSLLTLVIDRVILMVRNMRRKYHGANLSEGFNGSSLRFYIDLMSDEYSSIIYIK